jgi:hypothetical protein
MSEAGGGEGELCPHPGENEYTLNAAFLPTQGLFSPLKSRYSPEISPACCRVFIRAGETLQMK